MKKYIYFLTCLCFLGLCGSAEADTVKVGRKGVFTTTDKIKASVSSCSPGQVRVGGVCIYPDAPVTPQSCPSGKVWATDRAACISCPDNCSSCTETCSGTTSGKYCTRNGISQIPYTYTCTNCDPGFALNNTTKICEHSCPAGKVWSEKAGDCVTSCPAGQILHPSLEHCVPEGGCLSPYCTSCPDLQGCLACQEGFALNNDGVCASTCGDGEVYNPVIQECVTPGCGEADFCSNCVSTPQGDYCAACDSEHVVAGKVYLSPTDGLCHDCGSGPQNPDLNLHCSYCGNLGRNVVCRGCEDGYTLNADGTCTSPVPSCPAGQYHSISACADCPENCDICNGRLYTLTDYGVGEVVEESVRCSVCAEGFRLSEDFLCVPEDTPVCGVGEYTQYDGTCAPCPDDCNSCEETCADGYYLVANGQCGRGKSASRNSSIVSCVACKHNIDAECVNIFGDANPWQGTNGGYYWCADGTHSIPAGKTCWEGYGHYQTITVPSGTPSYTAVSLRFWGNTAVNGSFSANYLSVGLDWGQKTSPATFTFNNNVTVNILFILQGDKAVFNGGLSGPSRCLYQYGAGNCTCSGSSPKICQ